jgi:(p)ppGpp synthase/HD superfamily hydrolase
MTSLIKKALQISKDIHKNQKRNNGTDYINHPINVSKLVDTNKLKVIALLHDTIEDGNVTVEYLQNKGIPLEIIKVVLILSKKKDENYLDFILRISNNKDAILVKLADLNDNLKDLKEGTKKDKYRLARHLLIYKLKEKIGG